MGVAMSRREFAFMIRGMTKAVSPRRRTLVNRRVCVLTKGGRVPGKVLEVTNHSVVLATGAFAQSTIPCRRIRGITLAS